MKRWKDEEVEYLDYLAKQNKAWGRIADRVNEAFDNNRTPDACRRRWSRYCKEWEE